MQLEELQRKLEQSEAKRAKLVVELHQAQLAAEAANASARLSSERARLTLRSSSADGDAWDDFGSATDAASRVAMQSGAPSMPHTQQELMRRITSLEDRLERSEKLRAQLMREGTGGGTPAGGGGGLAGAGVMSITSVSESDADFGLDEEEDAREHARQVMSELVRAVHGQRTAQTELAAARLQLADARTEIDRAKQREVELLRMLNEYQKRFMSFGAGRGGGSNGPIDPAAPPTRMVNATAASVTADGLPIDALGVGLQAARVKLLEMRVKELTDEVTRLNIEKTTSKMSSVLASVQQTGSVGNPSKVDGDARLLAKTFALEQSNAELHARVREQDRMLSRVQQALVDLGIARK
jgi:DNA repair exonuclease SbcCD ATPase subunit